MANVRLAFTPQSDFVYNIQNGAAYQEWALKLPREMYQRRLYVVFTGAAGFLINAEIVFKLNKRELTRLPYIVAGASALSIFLPGGLASANPARNDAIMVSFSGTEINVFPWNMTIAADEASIVVHSSTVAGTAMQFFAVHSNHLW